MLKLSASYILNLFLLEDKHDFKLKVFMSWKFTLIYSGFLMILHHLK